MENIMSINWTAPCSVPAVTEAAWLRRFVAPVERRLTAFFQRRLEQIAIAQLNAMSDRDLKDIGLIRSEIDSAVRFAPTGPGAPNGANGAQTKWRGVTRRKA
jgi:uncharacterized protein YjiS (DUF1127 family)